MKFPSAVLVSLIFHASRASWMQEIVSPEGLKIGAFVAKLQDNKHVNSSFLERISLNVDYGEMGVQVARNAKINDVEMSFYTNDVGEGRGNDEGGDFGGGKKDNTLSFLIGFKGAAMITAVLATMKLLVLKALLVAKVALVTAASILVKKLMHHEDHTHYELEHHESQLHPVFAEYPHHHTSGSGDFGYQPSASAHQYYAYNNAQYAPSAQAESQAQFQAVEAPQSNSTINQNQVKRKDIVKKKQMTIAPTILTIRRYHLD